MCLLALINIESEFKDDDLLDFIKRNKDGFGFMCPDGKGAVAVEKQSSSDSEKDGGKFIERFRWWRRFAEESGQKEFAMHTRMRTSGLIDSINAHPHYVAGNVFMMHNGVLSISTKDDETASDTIHYVRKILAPILTALPNPDEFIHLEALSTLIGRDIGSSNKFVFCSPSGFSVVNRAAGTEFRKSWFSNTYAWSIHNEGARYRWQGGWQQPSGAFPGFDDDEVDWRFPNSKLLRPITSIKPIHRASDESSDEKSALSKSVTRFDVHISSMKAQALTLDQKLDVLVWLHDDDTRANLAETLYEELATEKERRFWGLTAPAPMTPSDELREVNAFVRSCKSRCDSRMGRIRFFNRLGEFYTETSGELAYLVLKHAKTESERVRSAVGVDVQSTASFLC